jgi:hypothetical protein
VTVPTLMQLLSAAEAESGLKVGTFGPACQALADAIRNDATLQGSASAVLSLSEGVQERDHISRWRAATLRRCLGITDDC